jgi:lysophospholipase L1-like esterase
MQEARPTFVSVWIGNNDALEAATRGVLGGADSLLTPLASFQASLNQLVAAIRATPSVQGGLLVGVVDPTLFAPILQPGAFFFLARDPATGTFQGKPVNNNCSPITPLGQPNPLAANLVSFRGIADANLTEINCDPAAAPLNGTYLLDQAELTVVRTRIGQYNTALQAAATSLGFAFVNPNTNATILGLLNEKTGTLYQRIRKCQDLPAATNFAQFQAAVLNSCPVTGPTAAPNLFGSLISFDAVHPSAEAHRVFAGIFAQAINTRYGTTLSTLIT